MYKALITDVDGTLIANKRDGVPTEAVKRAIALAKDRVHIGIATSRPIYMLEKIFAEVEFSGPCIISGGTQIYDPTTKKVVWEKCLEAEKVAEVAQVLLQHVSQVLMNDGQQDVVYSASKTYSHIFNLFSDSLEKDLAEVIHQELAKISGIAPYKIASHSPGKIDIVITHGLGTKQHGIMEVAKLLNIETKDIIGVGDGYNDFPLLMASGLKVAMGNAVEELKAIADYVAPPVNEDGLAQVIQKFVLNIM